MVNTNKILISHAFEDTIENKENLARFYKHLKETMKGFNILFDLDKVTLGKDIDKFMKKAVNESLCVICICTPAYLERSKKSNSGVSKELTLIKNRCTTLEGSFFEVYPIIFDGDFDTAVPQELYSLKNRVINTSDFTMLEKDLIPTNFIPFSDTLLKEYKDFLVKYNFNFVDLNPDDEFYVYDFKGRIGCTGSPKLSRVDFYIENITNKTLEINFKGLIDNNAERMDLISKLDLFNKTKAKKIHLQPNGSPNATYKINIKLGEVFNLQKILIKKTSIVNDKSCDYYFDAIFELNGILFSKTCFFGTPVNDPNNNLFL